MKIWKKYKRFLLTGEWHIHTNYTDGENTVFEFCEKAKELNIPVLAFTEHVGRELTYDFNKFLEDIERAKDHYPDIVILTGIEAKVLPNGELDVSKEILREVDYPIFAFHSFPSDLTLYINALKKVLKNKYTNTWAHPGLFLRMKNLELPINVLLDIFKIMRNNCVLLEVNRRYKLPKKEWIDIAVRHGVQLVRGGDIHSIKMLESYKDMRWRYYARRT